MFIFVVKKVKKMAILCFGQCPSQWSYFQGQKSYIYFLDHNLGHPVQQILQKPDFSVFPVSRSGFPMGHRYWKDVSLFWSNSYFMPNARGSRDTVQLSIYLLSSGRNHGCTAVLLSVTYTFFRIPCTYNEQVLQHVIFLSN